MNLVNVSRDDKQIVRKQHAWKIRNTPDGVNNFGLINLDDSSPDKGVGEISHFRIKCWR